MMRKLRDLTHLARDFYSVVRGRDYFHQHQGLGRYFDDPRCYYNDLRGKASWTGPMDAGVPLLYLPSLRQNIQFPITILQYGLGSADRWFLERAPRWREQAAAAVRWTVSSLTPQGSLKNHFVQMHPADSFYSDNSAMAQGEALSLLCRAVRFGIVDGELKESVQQALPRIAANMVLPLERGGTRLTVGTSEYFCELCRTDGHVVLNGWIFALYGLVDYCDWRPDDAIERLLGRSLETLEREAECYLLGCDWSRYDNRGRIASPFYHELHISQFESLCRLTGKARFGELLARLRAGNSRWNKLWFTGRKVRDKLFDRSLFTTSGPPAADICLAPAA